MTGLGVVLIIGALVVAAIGISFVMDLRQGLGADASGGSVDSVNPQRTYTFLRIRGRSVAWIVTILTFVVAAALLIGGIIALAS